MKKKNIVPVLVSLPSKSKMDDLIFNHKMWGVAYIRPTFSVKQCNVNLNAKYLTDYQLKNFKKPYFRQIERKLNNLYKKFGKVILLDVSIASNLKYDLIIDPSKIANEKIMAPIISTFEMAKVHFCEKRISKNRNIIDTFGKPSVQIYALKLIISSDLFAKDEDEPLRMCKGLRVFEQTVSLALSFS